MVVRTPAGVPQRACSTNAICEPQHVWPSRHLTSGKNALASGAALRFWLATPCHGPPQAVHHQKQTARTHRPE